ncbi:MAG: TetR/AcrR family transcriptional regulator [Roseiarcus sp.]|jgi:AcrR family transcriptional regulator
MVTSAATRASARNSDAMRARILAAVAKMIVRDGLSAIGVNALAREAGCDKVLIYRYFGDLEGVWAAYAAQSDFWWSVEELTRGIDPSRLTLPEAMKTILRRHAEGLRARPVTLAVLAAELTNRTRLVVALEAVRERRALELSKWIAERYPPPPAADLEAVGMLIGVAINYLAVRARAIRVMGGVKIRSEADWERILAAVDALIDGVLRAD